MEFCFMNQYNFDITINLTDIAIEAETEKEARSKLTEQVADYFTDTQVSISDKEAVLTDIFRDKL